MAFSNISNQALGKFLQVAYIDGIRNQISEDFQDFEFVKMGREGDPNGKQLNFLLKTSYGPSAVQYRNPNFTTDFPKSQRIKTSEYSAFYKEIESTVEIEYNLWKQAKRSPAKYAEPLAEELLSKVYAAKRRLAADLYGDGTGVVGQVTSADDTNIATGVVAVTLTTTDAARGHLGFFEFDDALIAADLTGTPVVPTTAATFYGWLVVARDRKNSIVTLQAVDSDYTPIAVTGAPASNLVATNVFYRVGQPTIPDLTSPGDYGSVTEVMAGLESLAAADGRLVHGITMSGSLAGSVEDFGTASLDTNAFENALNDVKIRTGEKAYAYKKMMTSPEVHSFFITGREGDRRFQTVDDTKRGGKIFGYQHRSDFLEMVGSEFCPRTRIWMPGEARQNQGKTVECWTTDFESVQANDSGEFHLKPSPNGGHQRLITTYMEASGVMLSRHPAAIASIRNFTI